MLSHRELLADGGVGLTDSIERILDAIESMPGDPARSYMERNGFVDLKSKEYRKGRQVYSHKDTPDLVYKIGVGTNAWQNNIEAGVWEDDVHPSFDGTVPKEVKQFLAPVLLSDDSSGDTTWLVMPRASTGDISETEAVELVDEMSQHDWVVTDYHPDNFGRFNGEVLFIDYGQLKPVRYLDDRWREIISDMNWR